MVVIIKSTEVPLNTLQKCIVIAYVGFLGVCGAQTFFGLKKGINFDQFGLGMFFMKKPLLHH